MASLKQSSDCTPLADLTNSNVTNGCPVASSSPPTPIDPKERRRQRDRERYAQMDSHKKEELLKRRREARQQRKVAVAQVNQDHQCRVMVQDNEIGEGQSVDCEVQMMQTIDGGASWNKENLVLDEDNEWLHRGDKNHVHSQLQECIMSGMNTTKKIPLSWMTMLTFFCSQKSLASKVAMLMEHIHRYRMKPPHITKE